MSGEYTHVTHKLLIDWKMYFLSLLLWFIFGWPILMTVFQAPGMISGVLLGIVIGGAVAVFMLKKVIRNYHYQNSFRQVIAMFFTWPIAWPLFLIVLAFRFMAGSALTYKEGEWDLLE